MRIAQLLGLDDERFCKVIATTKMFGMVNVLGHVSELHFEKYLNSKGILFEKAPTDRHYDYVIDSKRIQVKRWETASTDDKYLGVNLTKTHGNRVGPDAFYTRNAFDTLILLDVGFQNFSEIKIDDIPKNKKYSDRLPGKYKMDRKNPFSTFQKEFLDTLKQKNEKFPPAMELLRKKYGFSYTQLVEKISGGLPLDELDTLFTKDNFRLITGAKGFAAEQHFNMLLDKNRIPYKQEIGMYDKVDHMVSGKRIQVKTIHGRSTDTKNWGFKPHKTHGNGVGELYKNDEFDYVALFIGYNYNGSSDKYTPTSAKTEFLFIPINDIDEHPNHPGYLKRVQKVPRDKYNVNDLSIFKK